MAALGGDGDLCRVVFLRLRFLRATNNGSKLPTNSRTRLLLRGAPRRPLMARAFALPFANVFFCCCSSSGSERDTRRPHASSAFPMNTYRRFCLGSDPELVVAVVLGQSAVVGWMGTMCALLPCKYALPSGSPET